MLFLSNEIIFIFQIFFIGVSLLFLSDKQYELLLYQLFFILLIIINIFSNFEVKIFGFHTTSIEPLAIGMYFIGIILYSFDKNNSFKIIKTIYKINFFILVLLLSIFSYNSIENTLSSFVYNIMYNFFVSITSFSITYFIEQKSYGLFLPIIKDPFAQSISVSISQLLDTFLYTIFIFYNRPLKILLDIFFFSYAIKLICISSYTIFLLKKNHE